MKKTFSKAALIAAAASMIITSGIVSLADGPSVPSETAAVAAETNAVTEASAEAAAESSAEASNSSAASDLSADPVLNATEDQRVVDFYKDSILIGDSVADGFKRYCIARNQNPLLANINFQTQARYSIHDEIQPIGTEGVNHLWYGGAQHYAYELVSLVGAKHVYLSLGLNDIKGRPSEVLANYKSLISSIATANPAADITIISTTYIYPAAQTKLSGIKSWAFDNDTVRKLNTSLQELCTEKGYGYIDIANRLADANGNLDPKYCTDEYIHQNADAYVIWVQALREYAASQNYLHANDVTETTAETTAETVAENTAAANA
ncbi:GDSL-type esterase/lipase family protein [Oribacterium sp. P6A1]|uniref:GDSL-type esterase/lipase family protein n=1 Tax=Oribacterium sp. P6A1 TaxID=1410612 RepID=UPI0005698991|nr:GDSL-type esterase/lipase family protein [Oribacterium sp. P6A1]